jgi:hypothetical protein
MKSKIIFSVALFLSTLILFSGCKKKTEDFLGPEYNKAPGDLVFTGNITGHGFDAFNVVKLSGFHFYPTAATSINIGTNYQYYVAKFNHTVRWTITISSWKTHAQKVLTGYSDYIDESNSIWDGGSSNDYFFGYNTTNDSVEVKLTVQGSDLVAIDTIKLTGMKIYTDVFNGINHILIDDFEGTAPLTAFSPFYPDLDDLGGGNFGNNAYNGIKNQGNFSYRMYGKDMNNNTYIGSNNTPTLNDIPSGTITETDPNEVYINLYIYGAGRANTTVSVIAFENDANQAMGTTFNQTINDKYIYQIGVDWTGWKLVSFRYSAFKRPNTGAGLGNNHKNPEKLSGLALELDSYPTPGYEVEGFVDMVVVTENGVFQR